MISDRTIFTFVCKRIQLNSISLHAIHYIYMINECNLVYSYFVIKKIRHLEKFCRQKHYGF